MDGFSNADILGGDAESAALRILEVETVLAADVDQMPGTDERSSYKIKLEALRAKIIAALEQRREEIYEGGDIEDYYGVLRGYRIAAARIESGLNPILYLEELNADMEDYPMELGTRLYAEYRARRTGNRE